MEFIILTNNVDGSPILLNVKDISCVIKREDTWAVFLLSDPDAEINIKESAIKVAAILKKDVSNN